MPQQTTFEQIHTLSREYRRQLKHAAPKRIEDFLNRVEDDARGVLFQNLLHIDIEFQRRKGHEPSSEEYLKRFPSHGKLIRQAFFESTMMSADAGAQTPADQRTELEDSPAARQLGSYELVRQIGRGAFGAVYQAKHLQRGDMVALKLLPLALDANADASGDADRLHKFRREFRALCDVNHPNLVGMQSLEVDGRQWFFTMDLIDGTDFLDYVRPGGKLDIGRLRSATRQLAEGLQALHRHRIIHRDLKPANVMVDHNGKVLILDFGLVMEERPKADFTVLMSQHGFAGTPLYAAPEQMFGDCNQASDWYAVGIMLFEGLTGKHPFGGSGAEVMRAKSSADPPPLSEELSLPTDLTQLVDDLLQREPEQRPHAEAILDRLGGSVDNGSRDSTDSLSAMTDGGSRLTLIGREQELQTLSTLHRQLQQQRVPRAVFVKGRSGEGKTALADEFLHSLHTDYSSLVLTGRCYDRESVPFKAVDAVIDSLVLFLRSQQDDDVRRWLPDDIGLLAQLFPMLRRVTSISEVTPATRDVADPLQLRHRAFAALRDLLTAISERTPVVLFIDDLQWGDGESATALRDVLQPPEAPAVMLLGTFRSDEADESAFLKEWTNYTAMTDECLSQHSVEVGPLSEEQCLNLLAVRLGTEASAVRQQAQDLFAGTRGNPYFLDQLLEGLDSETGSIEAVPLSELIRRRLQRLPTSAGPLLHAIAVAGQAVALSEAAAVAQQPHAAMSTITHMRNERLVRLIGTGEESTVDTYHDKVRETVLAELPTDERRRLHRDFAKLFLQLPSAEAVSESANAASHPRVYDLAFHLLEAGDARAFAFQLAAGENAVEECALETARGYLITAASLLPDDADDATRFRLLFAQAETQRGMDQLDDAITSYQQALPLAGKSVEAARCEYGTGQGLLRKGEYLLARQHLSRALAHVGEWVPLTSLGWLLALCRSFVESFCIPTFLLRRYRRRRCSDEENALASMIVGSGHYCFMASYSELAMTIALGGVLGRLSDDPAERVLNATSHATNFSGSGFGRLGRWILGDANQQINTIKSPITRAIAEHNLGGNSYMLGEFDQAEALLQKCLPAFQRVHHHHVGLTLHWLRHTASVRGDARRIEHWAQQELRFGEATGEVVTIAYGRYGLADALSRRGEFQRAIELATQAVRVLEESGLIVANIARQELGRALLQASDYSRATEVLARTGRNVLRGCMMFEVFQDTFALYAEVLAGPHFSRGRSEFTSARLRQMASAARRARWLCGRFPTLRPHACRVSGRVACAAGRSRKALKYFDEAIRAAERVGARYELARTWIDKSWLPYPEASADRARGLALLKELHCVLPEAETERLNHE